MLPSLLPLKALGLDESLNRPAQGLLSSAVPWKLLSAGTFAVPEEENAAGAAGEVPALNAYQVGNVLLRGRRR